MLNTKERKQRIKRIHSVCRSKGYTKESYEQALIIENAICMANRAAISIDQVACALFAIQQLENPPELIIVDEDELSILEENIRKRIRNLIKR